MCQLQYGASPMQLLRNLRLDKIRQELLSASVDSNVSEVAMRWGYTHLGRFAAAYRKRFGEAPNETRQAGAAAVIPQRPRLGFGDDIPLPARETIPSPRQREQIEHRQIFSKAATPPR